MTAKKKPCRACKRYLNAVFEVKTKTANGNQTIEKPYNYCPACGGKYPRGK